MKRAPSLGPMTVSTDREKVMDLEFKQEFKKGWFGNATVGAGTTVAGDRKDEMIS